MGPGHGAVLHLLQCGIAVLCVDNRTDIAYILMQQKLRILGAFAMAHVQTAIGTQSLGEKIIAPVRAFGAFLVRLSEANVRVRELERLSALSDDELSKIGVAREDIVQHVYRGAL